MDIGRNDIENAEARTRPRHTENRRGRHGVATVVSSCGGPRARDIDRIIYGEQFFFGEQSIGVRDVGGFYAAGGGEKPASFDNEHTVRFT